MGQEIEVMERKLIESLLADRALGNLSEESCHLLEEYISGKTEHIDMMKSYENTVSGLSERYAYDIEMELPAYPAGKIERIYLNEKPVKNVWPAAAAIFLLLIVLTFSIRFCGQKQTVCTPSQQTMLIRSLVDNKDIPALIPTNKFFNDGHRRKNKSNMIDVIIEDYKIRGKLL